MFWEPRRSVMVDKLIFPDQLRLSCELKAHRVPTNFCLVPHLSSA